MPVPTCSVTLAADSITVAFPAGNSYVAQLSQLTDVTITQGDPMSVPRETLTNGVSSETKFDFPNKESVEDYFPPNILFSVNVHINDGRIISIPMGDITNQLTWVNTLAGAVIAQTAISTAWNAL